MSVTDQKTKPAAPKMAQAKTSPRAVDQVSRALNALCASLGPGGRVPTHTELMRRYDASERAVREALDELHRNGRILRRRGAGTFVTETGAEKPFPTPPAALTDSRTLVAIAQTDHSFFDRCLDLLCRHAEARDLSLIYRPVLSHTPDLGPMLTSPAAGFVVFSYALAPLAKRLQESGARVVVCGTPPTDAVLEVPCIYGDHEHGGYLVASHLIELGHRRIAFVHSGEGLHQMLRWRGHQRALQEARHAGLAIVDCGWIQEMDTWNADPARAAAFLRAPGAPTALVAWNDHEAAKLLAILTRSGIKVPDDVSVAGYDDLPEGRLVYPPLTTVDHAIGQQLRAAVDLLTRPTSPVLSNTIVVPALIRRESTCALRTSAPFTSAADIPLTKA